MAVPVKYSVQITGPALSFLYFTASSSNEGFLLGSVVEQKIDFISDANEGGTKYETIVRISGVFPCFAGLPQPLYNNSGLINQSVLQNVNTQNRNELNDSTIIGWFSCRNNTQLKPSFRESVLHSQLVEHFSINNPRTFLLVLIQTTSNMNAMTQDFNSKFFHIADDRKWALLPGSILNWNQKPSAVNKTLYRSMMPTLEPCLLSKWSEELTKQRRVGQDLVAGVIENAHDHVRQILHRISKLNADIRRVNIELSKLKEEHHLVVTGGGALEDDGGVLQEENVLGDPPISPRLSSRPSIKTNKNHKCSPEDRGNLHDLSTP